MEILGVIPARGGSKGVPRKNLAPLAGRPLIAHTIDAARSSRRLTRVLVSTDDVEIAGVARSLGVDVPFLRPSHLAGDDTPILDVLVDLLRTLSARERVDVDILVLLQPTSPFRRSEHIDGAIDLLTSSGADSVVTVVPVPHQFTPTSLMELRGDRLVALNGGLASTAAEGAGKSPTRRQDKPLLFARNGPAVVAVHARVLLEQQTLYGSDTRALVMSREDSVDIDDSFDLRLAELMIASRPA
jgi:CMP-N,N'-diacetyllegionaminic acid synthase